MEFDIRLIDADLSYGYVFRMIFDDTKSLDLTSNVRMNHLNFILVDANNVVENLAYKNITDINKWMKVRVVLDSCSIKCTIDSITQIMPHVFNNLRNVYISFGRNRHPVFHSTDVAPMTLRNIIIKDDKGDTVNEWKLSKHNGNEVYDEISNNQAIAENGIWEIDKHRKWELKYTFPLNQVNIQIATDTAGGRIFFASTDSLYTYYIKNNSLQQVKVNKGFPFRAGGSSLIYDSKHDKLFSYSILYSKFVVYDFKNNSWSDGLSEALPPIQHHNRLIDNENNQLVVFGGYGMHQYSSVLAIHDLNDDIWTVDTLSCIYPRYLSAMGYWSDNKVLVLGGYGSVSGKQEEFPQNYNDLYVIDYKDKTCKKLLDFPNESSPRVFGNSLIIDKKSNKIYALAFNNDKFRSTINVFSIDLNKKTVLAFEDSIPFNFLDIDSYCDLLYYPEKSELYAIVLQSPTDGVSNIDIYSLAYPPLEASDVLQIPPVNARFPYLIVYLSGFIILLILICFIYFKNKEEEKCQETTDDEQLTVEEGDKHFKKVVKDKNQFSAILMLGGFQIFNKKGEDITRSISVVSKNLFLYILFYSFKNGKGVSSSKLNETLWPGMDKENAMNNRSVNISKLRTLMPEIGNIAIIHKNSSWYLNLGEDIFCDYVQIMNLLNYVKQENSTDIEILEQIIDLASAGVLLPNITTEWMDDYKSKYSSLLIDYMLKMAALPSVCMDFKLLLRISEVILIQDNINEDAIQMKCKALYRLGQKGLSKQSFDKFYTSYVNMLNMPPSFKYTDII
ncbi:MAG: hypothetical protein LBH32_01555 [Dysgonamonadaceae bacterium]|nr:hypothetical protein [Dysgonamonadaceae bacterium]